MITQQQTSWSQEFQFQSLVNEKRHCFKHHLQGYHPSPKHNQFSTGPFQQPENWCLGFCSYPIPSILNITTCQIKKFKSQTLSCHTLLEIHQCLIIIVRRKSSLYYDLSIPYDLVLSQSIPSSDAPLFLHSQLSMYAIQDQ